MAWGSLYDSINPTLLDAFGRIRVGDPKGLFASKQLYDNTPLYWSEETNGTATSAFQSNESRVDMTVSSDGDYVIRQSRQRMNYQPGKSQRILFTVNPGGRVADTDLKVGYFNSATTGSFNTGYDGIFFWMEGESPYFAVYKNGTEVLKVGESDWNIDTCQRVRVDYSKEQIFVMDFEWLGVGAVRFGVVHNGQIYYLHQYRHTNISDDGVYMTSPNHSIRYELRSTGGTRTVKHICSAVDSEGGEDILGLPRCASTGATHADISGVTTIYPLVGYRLKSTALDATIIPRTLSVISEGVSDFRIIFILNPTYTGGTPSWGATANSSTQSFAVSGTPSVTVAEGAWELNMGEVFGKDSGSINRALESTIRIGSMIDGTADEFVIGVQPLQVNADIDISLNWIEL